MNSAAPYIDIEYLLKGKLVLAVDVLQHCIVGTVPFAVPYVSEEDLNNNFMKIKERKLTNMLL